MCGIAGFVAPPGIVPTAGSRTHGGLPAPSRSRCGRIPRRRSRGPRRRAAARHRSRDGRSADGNEDGSATVVLNGEIYDCEAHRAGLERGHRFRSRSDTEVIAHAWEEEGEHCVDRLNGMFAFALWDAGREQLFLARDRMGEKPLYYTWRAGRLVFASELRALLAHPASSARLDLEGLARYLAYDYVPDPHSILRGVASCRPGTRWRPGRADRDAAVLGHPLPARAGGGRERVARGDRAALRPRRRAAPGERRADRLLRERRDRLDRGRGHRGPPACRHPDVLGGIRRHAARRAALRPDRRRSLRDPPRGARRVRLPTLRASSNGSAVCSTSRSAT